MLPLRYTFFAALLVLATSFASAQTAKKSGRVSTPAPTGAPLIKADIGAFPDKTERLDLFLLIGQSNMKGRGFMPEKAKNDPRIIMMHLPSDGWFNARHPLHLTGDAKTFKGHDNAGVGSGLMFAEKIAEASEGSRIGLIPAARGGTKIAQWSEKSALYTNAIRKVKLALEQGPAGKTKLRGVLWLQGEGDSNEEKIPLYADALSDLVDRLRADLADPTLPFIAATIGELVEKANSGHKRKINEILLDLPNQKPHTACVDARDVKGHIGDGTHYDTTAMEEIGRRFAKQLLELEKK